MRSSHFSLVVMLLGLHVAVATSKAQEPEPEISTVDRISKLGVDALLSPVKTFYTPGFGRRTAELSQRFADASKFFSKQLDVSETLRLAVLDEGHWNELLSRPYGASWLSPDRPFIVVMPAITKRGDFVEAMGEFLEPEMIRPTIDYIGLHNVARLYVRRYLYPEDFEGEPSVRWFEELMASYLMSAFLSEGRNALASNWERIVKQLLERPSPEKTSLVDFEQRYERTTGSLESLERFVWYQSTFSQKARELHESQGLELIRRLEAELPWDTFRSWESDALTGWLDPIAPDFRAWAAELSGEDR